MPVCLLMFWNIFVIWQQQRAFSDFVVVLFHFETIYAFPICSLTISAYLSTSMIDTLQDFSEQQRITTMNDAYHWHVVRYRCMLVVLVCKSVFVMNVAWQLIFSYHLKLFSCYAIILAICRAEYKIQNIRELHMYKFHEMNLHQLQVFVWMKTDEC